MLPAVNSLVAGLFQHTAARRRLGDLGSLKHQSQQFQHTAARRRLAPENREDRNARMFQHTAARRRLVTSLSS